MLTANSAARHQHRRTRRTVTAGTSRPSGRPSCTSSVLAAQLSTPTDSTPTATESPASPTRAPAISARTRPARAPAPHRPPHPQPQPQPTRVKAIIVKVLDGEKVKVKLLPSNKKIGVQILGIDAPGPQACGGPESWDSLQRTLPEGLRVWLYRDTSQPDKTNKGRLSSIRQQGLQRQGRWPRTDCSRMGRPREVREALQASGGLPPQGQARPAGPARHLVPLLTARSPRRWNRPARILGVGDSRSPASPFAVKPFRRLNSAAIGG